MACSLEMGSLPAAAQATVLPRPQGMACSLDVSSQLGDCSATCPRIEAPGGTDEHCWCNSPARRPQLELAFDRTEIAVLLTR